FLPWRYFRYHDRFSFSGLVVPAQQSHQMQKREGVLLFEALGNEHDVARIAGVSVASVRRWRLLGQGPRFLKIGASVRYRPEDVSAWLDSRPSGGGHQEAK